MSFGTVLAEKITTESGYSLGAGNASSFKNRIINGEMDIDQRNAGASVTPAASTYTLDRWRFGCPSARMSVQQNAGGVTPPNGFRNYVGVTTTSAYAPSATEAFTLAQFIEGFNAADLMCGTANAKTFTLSFWVRSSLTGNFGASFVNENGATRSYPFSYTIFAANTWEFKTITVTGDTSGTWGTTTGVGLGVFFSLGAGSDFVGTANAWGVGDRRTVSGAVSVVGTSGATWQVTGVQLEVGTVATSFDFRSIGTELALCQRYYEVGYLFIRGAASSAVGLAQSFAVVKRASPTTTVVVAISGTVNTLTPSTNTPLQGVSMTGTSQGTGFLECNWSAISEL